MKISRVDSRRVALQKELLLDFIFFYFFYIITFLVNFDCEISSWSLHLCLRLSIYLLQVLCVCVCVYNLR